jgi:hypothetical protein
MDLLDETYHLHFANLTANVSIIYVLQNQQTHFSFTKELSEGTANWMIL